MTLTPSQREELRFFIYDYYTFDACAFMDWTRHNNICIHIHSFSSGWKIARLVHNEICLPFPPFDSNCFKELLWQVARVIYRNEHRKWPHEP